ncbi:hypothetical protein BCT30_17435 [Enterovibrio norvegicus]|uniref:YeaC family protein n=1 Tax=Enterovibrio norvegicus TaxID=188144 RepID=UPI000C82F863|nr:DUF1315 family protein [Enterovibrio norvegicus]MCC4797557.1 DUF1315 family protein [Enterovibrio norvegicus]PMH66298.1 hypothetical protein BCU62_09815 [Enterovibrio norvegicus]PMI33671.1 hypothetical protein BCU47_08910 [Enterovibrio norvegicus]PMI36428.1 hypothetical protein BCU46_14075 [Enterovibrio norvegicus]PMN50146.1 hypothetical protein BCT30_17435 [Enterovibrio norvegicus]
MDIEQLLESITPEAFERLNYAVATGKWPEGTPLTQEQRDNAIQVVMLYQSRNNTDPQHMSVAAGGDIKFKSKSELKRDFSPAQETIVQVKATDD